MPNGEITPDKTKVALTPVQLCIIVGAIVSGTLVVSGFANGLKEEVKDMRQQMEWVMTDKRMNDWVWEANRANPNLHLPSVQNPTVNAQEHRDEEPPQ